MTAVHVAPPQQLPSFVRAPLLRCTPNTEYQTNVWLYFSHEYGFDCSLCNISHGSCRTCCQVEHLAVLSGQHLIRIFPSRLCLRSDKEVFDMYLLARWDGNQHDECKQSDRETSRLYHNCCGETFRDRKWIWSTWFWKKNNLQYQWRYWVWYRVSAVFYVKEEKKKDGEGWWGEGGGGAVGERYSLKTLEAKWNWA